MSTSSKPSDNKDESEVQTRDRGPSNIELHDPSSVNRLGGSTVLGPLNDTMESREDSSQYQSFHDQLNHTMSIPGSVDNSLIPNFANNNNRDRDTTLNTDSLRLGTISSVTDNNLNSITSMSSNTRNANNINNNTNNAENGKKYKKSLNEKRAISGYRNDEIITRSQSGSLFTDETNNNTNGSTKNNGENDTNSRMTNSTSINNGNNKNSNGNGENTQDSNSDTVPLGKPRMMRIASEPNQVLSQQLSEFQTKAKSDKLKTKRSSMTDWWLGQGARSVPYQLMEDTQFEPTIMSQTATLHPAKAGHQFLSDHQAKSKFERLDFDLQESQITHRMTWKTRKQDSRGFVKWTLCLLIGFFTGTTMFLCVASIDFMKDWNTSFTEHGFNKIGVLTGFIRFFAINLVCALIAGMLVSYIAPSAAGSGIPSVKAYLNGSHIPTLLDFRTLIVKLVGISFSVSGFFVVGKEGPMVHTGSALASGIALGRNKALGIDTKINYSFRNDADARDLISCGAAAGVSAAFGAPIGGMLFALEEVSSFWQPGLTWRAFFTSAMSNFTLQMWLGCYEGHCGEASKESLISYEADSTITSGLYNMKEFIFFVLMGFVGGIVGMLFNAINVQLCLWRKHRLKSRLSRVIEVLVVSCLTTMLLSLTPLMIGCVDTDESNTDNCGDPYDYGEYTCESGQWNPLASLFMVSSEDVISALFHESSGCWSSSVLFVSGIIYFVLAVVTYGISIPSGLFVPLILIGSNLGHFLGDFWNDLWDDDFDVGTYALIGASAVLGGSTRMTISLTAIILEITNDIYYLMPIMITIMVAKWVGDRFNSALYDSHIGLKDIPYLESKLPSWIPTYICADDVMRDQVTTLPIIVNLEQILAILNDSNEYHNAFPIIESKSKLSHVKTSKFGWRQNDGRFVGIILRWHILIMLSRKLYSRNIDDLINLPRLELKDITDRSHKGDKVVTREEYDLPPENEWKYYYMDLSPYMSLSPHSINRSAPIKRVYHMFRAFGMRHLVVLDKKQMIAGIITSHELLESNLEHMVERVHKLFDFDATKTEELFDERIRFLAGQTSTLRTSGNINNPFYQKLIEYEFQTRQHTPLKTHAIGNLNDEFEFNYNINESNITNLDLPGTHNTMNNSQSIRNGQKHLMSFSKSKRQPSKNENDFFNKQKTPLFEPTLNSKMSIMEEYERSPSRTATAEPSTDREMDPVGLGPSRTSIN